MPIKQWTAKAPGSTILFGEHAVLAGFGAIVYAVNAHITIHFEAEDTEIITIHSALGSVRLNRNHPVITYPLQFATATICSNPPQTGGTFTIQSEFPATIGLGSSAAVTVAMLGLLYAIRHEEINKAALLVEAVKVIRAVQGSGSGADVAASVFGNCVFYTGSTQAVYPVKVPTLPLSLHYCGYKTPTAEVISAVQQQWSGREFALQALYQNMSVITQAAKHDLNRENCDNLAEYINNYHHLLVQLGVEDWGLQQLRAKLFAQGSQAVKISGSGRGDCLLALGYDGDISAQSLPLQVSEKGLEIQYTR